MDLTQHLKSELWHRYGSLQHPAEWDGQVYGGGKLSQRFWEYLIAIQMMDLSADAVVLDIGGGSPTSGAGFFGTLLSKFVNRVVILDSQICDESRPLPNVTYAREPANYESVRRLLRSHPQISHITSISVFEHVEPSVRQSIVQAINDEFHGAVFVSTFEYHPRRVYFEHQLTARTVSTLFSPLSNYFLDEFVTAPVLCENAFDQQRIARLGRNRGVAPGNLAAANIPLWHPVAVRFIRNPAPDGFRGER
jgi:hypothetical protein